MTAPLYRPPTRVVTVEIPFLALVTQSDPEFERRKHREVEYVIQRNGRIFLADPYVRGAYNRLSNIYAVGQPYGSLDEAIEAALAPTVGNDVPGLYQGVAPGSWA